MTSLSIPVQFAKNSILCHHYVEIGLMFVDLTSTSLSLISGFKLSRLSQTTMWSFSFSERLKLVWNNLKLFSTPMPVKFWRETLCNKDNMSLKQRPFNFSSHSVTKKTKECECQKCIILYLTKDYFDNDEFYFKSSIKLYQKWFWTGPELFYTTMGPFGKKIEKMWQYENTPQFGRLH